jgi:hypothetical protein
MSGNLMNSTQHRRPSQNARTFFGVRLIVSLLIACALGAATWVLQRAIFGEATFDLQPEVLGWFAIAGLVIGTIDPRNPILTGPAFYFGAFILWFPFTPSANPHAPQGLQTLLAIFGLLSCGIMTGVCFLAGTFVPSTVAYAFPFKSRTLRKWAGYVSNDDDLP